MKIIESSAGALTNFEVLDLLRSRGAGTDPTRAIASVSPSEFEVFDYLEQTAACNQTREIISEFVDECKKFDLAKAEILDIVNLRPACEPQIFPIIDEFESRMDGKVEELLETITRILPPRAEESNDEAANGEDETETETQTPEPNAK